MKLTGLETQVGGIMVLITFLGLLWRQLLRPAVLFARRVSGRLDQVLDATEQLPSLVDQQVLHTAAVDGLTHRLGELRDTVSATARISALEDGKLHGRVSRLEDDTARIWRQLHQPTTHEGLPI